MDSKPAPTNQDIPREIGDFAAFVNDIAKESDRAAAIIVAAKCDILLRELIAKFLLPCHAASDELLDGDSPLGSFTSRITFAYRAGLIKAEFARALHLIRRIRNEFAHEPSSATFNSGPHKDRVRELVAPFKSAPFFSPLRQMLFGKDDAGAEFRASAAIISLLLTGAVQNRPTVDDHLAVDLVAPIKAELASQKKGQQ